MLRVLLTLLMAVGAATVSAVPAIGQVPRIQPVVLDSRVASSALDAVPAVFAVAQNLEGVDLDLGIDSMTGGFSDLATQTAAQEQLTVALGVYGFESYGDWAATIQTIFSAHAYVRRKGLVAPAVKSAMQQVMDDPGIPQRQKDVIKAEMNKAAFDDEEIDDKAPSPDNLVVVIALMPQIESTIAMMQAMQ